MVTRIDFESRSGHRRAVVRRIENNHVPPLGVLWMLEEYEAGSLQRTIPDFTARDFAEADARAWVKEPRRARETPADPTEGR